MKPRLISLFSGYGGLDQAIESAFGAQTVAVADIDPGANRILAHRFPNVPNLGDISAVDWKEVSMRIPYQRRDERAAAMYAQYQAGKSLAQVAEAFECSRQSVYDVFRWRGWEMRPKPTARPSVTWNGSKWSLRDNGYYGRTTGDRDMMHRAVWEHHVGPIPDGWDVHHKDRDRTNNDIANLECLPKDEHTRLHAAEAAKAVMPEKANSDLIVTGGFP